MMDKYSQSTSLLMTYAEFLDLVENDFQQSSKIREMALAQIPDGEDDDSFQPAKGENEKPKTAPSSSGGSSQGENEPKRVTAYRQLLKFIPSILHKEQKMLFLFQFRYE